MNPKKKRSVLTILDYSYLKLPENKLIIELNNDNNKIEDKKIY
jgi:hypothetical protein